MIGRLLERSRSGRSATLTVVGDADLVTRGLAGVRLVTSDAHAGAAVARGMRMTDLLLALVGDAIATTCPELGSSHSPPAPPSPSAP